MAAGKRTVAIFDLGGVLIDWDPRHLYRKLFDGDDEAVERFLSTSALTNGTAARMPAAALAEGASLLKAEHPHTRIDRRLRRQVSTR